MTMPTTPEGQFAKLERSLTNQTPSSEQIERIKQLREDAKVMGAAIIALTGQSREQSLALTHLEEVVMWSVKAIVLESRDEAR